MAEETDVDRQRHELELLAPAYHQARTLLADTTLSGKVLERVFDLVGMYHGDPADRAVWILGQIKEALREVEAAKRAIRDYESRKVSLERLKQAAG
jgi:hypothetical protein